mmetsp:Transcript_4051/g.16242  ORF Transcript_4051/g.16242 Transcript_4051/m.16242 type:complete len:264 (-) Transcript_4051:3184-3975(-)
MVLKRVDRRIQMMIEEGVRLELRSVFFVVGDCSKNQVVTLHHLLSNARVRTRPSVLWCYKRELGFSTHGKKRMRVMRRAKARGIHNVLTDEPFESFISQTAIRWCYYKDTSRILGSTFGCAVLQDFEALTPNLLARTIETVEGGGLIIVLVGEISSLRQLYSVTMDVHTRFRNAEMSSSFIPRFNERFVLSLADCSRCLVLDDEMNVLPICSKHLACYEVNAVGRARSSEGPPSRLVSPETSKVDTPLECCCHRLCFAAELQS